MKLTLRKASAIQAIINEQINAPFSGAATIGKYDNSDKLLAEGIQNFKNTIEQKNDLIDVLYFIRKLVGHSSEAAGISALLADMAKLAKREQFMKQLSATTAFLPSKQVIAEAISDIKKEPVNGYNRKDSISVSVVTKELVESAKKELVTIRKAKQSISDKLLHLNVTTEIDLSDAVTSVLQKYDII